MGCMTQPTVSQHWRMNGQSTRSRANHTRLSSQTGKEKDVTKKIPVYIAPWRSKIQRHSDDRELNQARSKPDVVDQPVRTARVLSSYTIITVNNTVTQTVFLIFPLLQTNITSQMWPSEGKRGEQVITVQECWSSSCSSSSTRRALWRATWPWRQMYSQLTISNSYV